MLAGIIAAVVVIGICAFAFIVCKAASDWDDYEDR